MAYFKPFINESGFHIPTYNDIKTHLIEEACGIYGQDIYLENDSQDYEFISLIADKIHDSYLAAQLVYNNRSPTSAVGEALDRIVKLNGIKRKKATKSTCKVIITGDPDTEIIGGIIADEKANTNWDLEPYILIPQSGILETFATCQKVGSVYAGIGQLNKIVTPTKGWINVNNNESAIMGLSVESQEALRARQAISTAKPSKTVLEGTIGGIAEIPDVTRYRVYENDTNNTDENTVPAHSICAVVEGGRDYDIANEIYLRKTPGCGTYGDVVIEIEAGTVKGVLKTVPIKYFRPRYYDIYTTIKVKRLPGYVSQITNNIVGNVTNYLNSLQIGEDLSLSALWGVALQAMPDLTKPLFSIISVTAGTSEYNQSVEDIETPFNYVTRGAEQNVLVVFA